MAESEHKICSPRPVLAASGKLKTDAAAILAIAVREEAELIVLGLPDNPEDPRVAQICRKLADLLMDGGAKVELVDESLSSQQADERMAGSNLTAAEKARRRDSEAACLILERFVSWGK